ncbi:MAG: translocation/assembly module TamB domain-containing protein [Candidatus Symbiothrix sp.]|nr:translocation/assembly module TamB domain-containing protein [Candidatus Symbiothrix sp.]
MIAGGAYGLLWLPSVQQKIKDIALSELMRMTHNRITIGQLTFYPFNSLQLREVYIEDLHGDTLLYAETLSAKFDLWHFRQGQFKIQSVKLSDFSLQLRQDSIDADFNFQFLIDAFASDADADTSQAIYLSLQAIALQNGRISYDVLSAPQLADTVFDTNHVSLYDLQSRLSGKINPDNLNFQLKSLSFREKSGLQLTDMSTDFRLHDRMIHIDRLVLHTPRSELVLSDLNIQTDGKALNGKASACFCLPDFRSVAPLLQDYPEDLYVEAVFGNVGSQLKLSELALNYGDHVSLMGAGEIADYQQWQTSPLRIELQHLAADSTGLQRLHLPIATPWHLAIQGHIGGSLPALKMHLQADSDCGTLTLDGTGGYQVAKNKLHWQLMAQTTLFDMKTLLQDSTFGWVSVQLQSVGQRTATGKITAQAQMHIDRFDYQNTTYQALDAAGFYGADSLFLTVHSDDKNLPFDIQYSDGTAQRKQLNVQSDLVDLEVLGQFSYSGLMEAVKESMPELFPNQPLRPKLKDAFEENITFRVSLGDLHTWKNQFAWISALPDSLFVEGDYRHDGDNLHLTGDVYAHWSDADTLQCRIELTDPADSLFLRLKADNRSGEHAINGEIAAGLRLLPLPDRSLPDLNISMQMAAMFDAMQNTMPISGKINGQLTVNNLFTTPIAFTRDLAVDSIFCAGRLIGDLRMSSIWSAERRAVALRATLNRDTLPPSRVTGFYMPETDSLMLTANLRNIDLTWFQYMVENTIDGLQGNIGADVNVSGTLAQPIFSGTALLNNVQAGVRQLNTRYFINDSLHFDKSQIELKNFTILDENKHSLSANGVIRHDFFKDWNPNITLVASDFQALNNARNTDSLFYGAMRLNGILSVKKSADDWVISGDITHANNSTVMVNIPSSASMAARYDMITYIHKEDSCDHLPEQHPTVAVASPPQNNHIPLRINLSLWLDESLNVGAIFNQITGDAVHVKGSGLIKLSYYMPTSAVSLQGNYNISSGTVGLSVANIAQKKFTVKEGGKLIFNGAPLATTFDLTALYNLRADLTVLDATFGNLLANPKVPVSCSINATGNMNKLALQYDVTLPDETEDVQRKLQGLLYTDDMKFKEIAYLLAFGTFLPASDNLPVFGKTNVVNSLASISSGGINQLLNGVLNDNWMVGTDLHTGQTGFDDLNMDVSVSGRLFNDRLTINGSVGYSNNTTQMNNFTGDFELEYKLTPSGNWVVKAYNETNNHYYEQAPTIQGVGVLFKRQARTFRKLFEHQKKEKK